MNTQELAILGSVILAFALYIPLGKSILRKEVTQNLATWILWGSLDFLVGASIVSQGGKNFWLSFAYSGGSCLIIWCILRSGMFEWTKVETRVVQTVLVSTTIWALFVWVYHNPYWATILTTFGVAVATIPQWKDAWKKPDQMPAMLYVGYTVVNILSTYGGATWSVEDRAYPATCLVLTIVITLIVVGRRQRRRS